MMRLLLSVTLMLGVSSGASAEQLANQLFGAQATASDQNAMPIGTYARGCGAGMVQLPESGPSWQAMRLSRNRNWGQPELVAYLIGLSQVAQKVGWPGLYIGDMSQPRGGPMTSGHSSHQSGLDADIWYLPPPSLALSRAERVARVVREIGAKASGRAVERRRAAALPERLLVLPRLARSIEAEATVSAAVVRIRDALNAAGRAQRRRHALLRQ